ncbi:MAG TPA: tyrosine-type recombinase/integrase [Nocardioidaceae bacterium]|nr:tyrosine-type recombinase/integrase [Nocardioidaceae bacterium]
MGLSSLRDCLHKTEAGRSPSRARQLAWVVSEMESFAATLPPSEQPSGSPGWLDPSFVAAYLSEADNGRLRTRGTEARPSPDATRRVRRACLRLLAAQAGVADPVEDRVALPDLHPKADERLAARAVRHWEWQALPVDASPADVRTAAMAVLVHEVGMRSGELAALVPSDLDLTAGTVTYQPRPPSTRTLPPPRTVSLSDSAVAALRHWLKVREILTENTPRTRTLWVSLAANHNGSGVRRPQGMPLQPTGLRRAHARAVAALNVHLAGTPGFEALPRTVGRLRRDKPEKAPDLEQR